MHFVEPTKPTPKPKPKPTIPTEPSTTEFTDYTYDDDSRSLRLTTLPSDDGKDNK